VIGTPCYVLELNRAYNGLSYLVALYCRTVLLQLFDFFRCNTASLTAEPRNWLCSSEDTVVVF
jgi:hypothetical protein